MKRALVSLAGLAWMACGPPVSAPMTFNFDRPADVETICLNVPVNGDGTIDQNQLAVQHAVPMAMGSCRTIDVNDNHTLRNMDVDPAQPGHFRGSRLFAVVTQSHRGEVAVVNLHPEFDIGPVDNNRTVPGYSFIPVGDFPGALAVDPLGRATYVANTTNNFITVLDNRLLLGSGEHRLIAPSGSPVQIALPGPAYDLAVVDRGGVTLLYATVPTAQAVYIYDITGVGDPTAPTVPGAPQIVTLVSSAGMRPMGIDGGLDDGGMPGEGGTADGGGGTPYPTIVQTADDGTVYVADSHGGYLHVLTPMGATGLLETTPLDTGGVVIRNFGVSPTIGPHATAIETVDHVPGIPAIDNKRFVYAISDVDGSVMVLDATNNVGPLRVNLIADRPECGAGGQPFDPVHCPKLFPTIHTSISRFDRLPLLAPATSIGFVSFTGNDQRCDPVDYLTTTPSIDCALLSANAANTPQPAVLRGLQAIVTLRTGQLQVVDLDDPDRTCTGANRTEQTTSGLVRPFQPHIPRFAAAFLPLPALTAAPVLQLLGANITPSTQLPSLSPTLCPSGSAMPQSCDPTNNWCVCLPTVPGIPTAVDPLASHDDTWTLTYEGAIPGLTLDNGGFLPVDGTTDQLSVQVPGAGLCERGALTGDRVTLPNDSPYVQPTDTNVDGGQIVPPLPTGAVCSGMTNGMTTCQAWFGDSATPCNRELEILHAADDSLQLRVVPDTRRCGPTVSADPAAQAAALRDAMLCCYPQVTQIAVRPHNAWTVFGQRFGYVHNVVNSADGCVADPNQYPTGRAFENTPYVSPAFSLQINSGTTTDATGSHTLATTRDTDFQFIINSGVNPLALSAGEFPVAAHYVCDDRRLYVVDQGRASLYEYTISPLSTPRTFN